MKEGALQLMQDRQLPVYSSCLYLEARSLCVPDLSWWPDVSAGMLGSARAHAVLTFVLPTRQLRMSYRDQQARLRQAAANCNHLHTGGLLDTLEKGVSYPVLHVDWTPFGDTPLTRGSTVTEAMLKEKALLPEDTLGPEFHLQQGVYEEVKRIEPDFAFSPRASPGSKAYIVLGFKSLDNGFSSVLESTWRDWTGARAIYLSLHNQYDLSKISFYHRVSPTKALDLFLYVVVVECWNVTAGNVLGLLDVVQRLRVERLSGYISLYRHVDPVAASRDPAPPAPDADRHSAVETNASAAGQCDQQTTVTSTYHYVEVSGC